MTEAHVLAKSIEKLLDRALEARKNWQSDLFLRDDHEAAFRLFNGFLEGYPNLAVDIYADTIVLFAHGEDLNVARAVSEHAVKHLLKQLNWVKAVILKMKNSPDVLLRRGVVIYGNSPSRQIREHGVVYAVDLQLNLDSSFYLDTRNLRAWAAERLKGKRVLNVFAYTGSLGVAALVGGARQVLQLDRNPRFLQIAEESCALNGLSIRRKDFIVGDFWSTVSRLRREGELFDCVIVDPPFFSQTRQGRVDLESGFQRLINKVRPLVGHEGTLVVVNNSLFTSGAEYMKQLDELCSSGYLAVDNLIPVPPDFTGFPETRVGNLPKDPSPFNHSTKIAVLRVLRKDRWSAQEV